MNDSQIHQSGFFYVTYLSKHIKQKQKMALLDSRFTYRGKNGFEYPKAKEYAKKQNASHWIEDEIIMTPDITDWNVKLSSEEKKLIGSILKGFAQTEVLVNDYWSGKVAKWFPKPEIRHMAVAFGNMEGIHADAYALLNTSLGLEDFEAFMEDETTKAKIDNLIDVADDADIHNIAKSLAIFSAFTEGVNLFSSFAILQSFSTRDLLKRVAEIVRFSIRDESLHSEAGCWLFNQLMLEYPEANTEELKQDIYEAARLSVKLEKDFIDAAFGEFKIENLDKESLLEYIKYRANWKLEEIKLQPIFEVDDDKLEKMRWFAEYNSGVEFKDFFAGRVTAYTKVGGDFSVEYIFGNNN